MKPRKYQKEGLNKLEYWRRSGNNKGLVVMAPGLGKTVLSAFDIVNFFAKTGVRQVLYLCDNNEILNRAKREYKRVFGESYSYGDYIGPKKTAHSVNFLFASFQAMAKHLNEFSETEFDYVVVDEAHHVPATTYRKSVAHFKPKFMLGLTATPFRLDGQGLDEFFGEPIFDLSLPNAIARGLVPDIDYRVIFEDSDKTRAIFKEGKKISIKQFNNEYFSSIKSSEIVKIIQDKAKKQFANPRIMIFCQSIEHAEEIKELIPESALIHSEIDQKECRESLEKFRKGNVDMIISVNMLNEGIDVPGVDTIVFLRSTVSPVIFYQQLGRGLRKTKNKKEVLVLDFVANYERIQILDDFQKNVNKSKLLLEEISQNDQRDFVGEFEQPSRFSLVIDTPIFKERKVSFEELFEAARAHFYHGYYTDEELLEQIRRAFLDLGRPLRTSDIGKGELTAASIAFFGHFGSFENGCQKAGVPFETARQTDEKLLNQLKTAYKEKGEALRYFDFKSGKLLSDIATFQNHFGSVEIACELAEVPFVKVYKVYGDEELLDGLRNAYQRLKRPLLMKDCRKHTDLLHADAVYKKHFGSFEEGCELAGVEYIPSLKGKSNEFHLEQIRKEYKRLGRPLKTKDFDDSPYLLGAPAFRKKFPGKSIADICELAGVPFESEWRKKSDEELIQEILDYYETVKRPLRAGDFKKPCFSSKAAYVGHFGSYKNACKKAGVPYQSSHRYSIEELEQQLLKKRIELGRVLIDSDIENDKNMASIATFFKKIGNMKVIKTRAEELYSKSKEMSE